MASFSTLSDLPDLELLNVRQQHLLVYELQAKRHASPKYAEQPQILRTMLNPVSSAEGNVCSFIDAQRRLSWASTVLSEVYQIEMEFFDWAQMYETTDFLPGVRKNEMEKLWSCRDYGDFVRIAFGFDALKLLSSQVCAQHEKRDAVMQLIDGDSLGMVFRRRFSCGIIFHQSEGTFRDPQSAIFIADSPSIRSIPYLAYQIWHEDYSLIDYVKDVIDMLIVDLTELIERASQQLAAIEIEVFRNPADFAHIRCLMSMSQQHELMHSQAHTMKSHIRLLSRTVMHITQATHNVGQIENTPNKQMQSDQPSSSEVFSKESTELGHLLESIDRDLMRHTKDLSETTQTLSILKEAQMAVDQADSIRRISWVTFIFLPLLFVAAWFGMKVDLFANEPTWTWYLVAAVVVLLLTLGALFGFKRMTRRRREHRVVLYDMMAGNAA